MFSTGNVVKSFKESKSAINSYFFGPEGTDKLTVKRFIAFQEKLQVRGTVAAAWPYVILLCITPIQVFRKCLFKW